MNVLPEEATVGKFDRFQRRNHKAPHYIPEAAAMIRKMLELVRTHHIQFDTYGLESEDEYYDGNLIQICIQPRKDIQMQAESQIGIRPITVTILAAPTLHVFPCSDCLAFLECHDESKQTCKELVEEAGKRPNAQSFQLPIFF